MKTQTRQRMYRVAIYLANDEWGNEVMEREAIAYALSLFQTFSTLDNPISPLIVEVVEHAGWVLSFYFHPQGNPQRPILVGTANDGAVFSPAQQNIREQIFSAEITQLPECRNRGERGGV